MLKKLKLVIIIIILILFSVIFSIDCFGFSIEYDKHISNYSLVTNMKSLAEVGFLINDNLFHGYGPRLKIMLNIPSVYIPMLIGHELVHGMTAKKANLDVEYFWLKRKCRYIMSENIYINSHISCAGLTFENELKDSLYKDQIMNGGNYKSAMYIMLIENSSFVTANIGDKKSNDLNVLCNHMKLINPDTNLNRSYINNVLIQTSLYDPSTIFNSIFLAHAFWTNQELCYNIPYIHYNFDFNLYPTSVTKEIGFSKNIGNKHFLKATFEWGYNIWNEYIKGFSLEFTNIPLYQDIISVDFKYHAVEKTIAYSLSTFHIGNSYIRWKHNDIKTCEIDDKNEFYFGYNFKF